MGLDSLRKLQARPAPGQDTGVLSHLLRGAGSLYLGTLVQLAGRLLFAVIVARLVGAEAVGVFTLGFVGIQALSMVATSGVEVALYHFVSPAVQDRDWAGVKGMFRASILTTGAAGILLSVLYALLIPYYPLNQSNGEQAASVLQLFAPALLFQVVVVVLGAFGMALGSPGIRVVADRLLGTIMQLVVLGVLLSLGLGIVGVILSYVGGMLCALVVAICLMWRLYPREGRAAPVWANIKRLYLYSYKQGLARIIGYVLMNSNLLVLGYLSGAGEVGIYAAASRLTLVGLLFLDAFGQMFGTVVANKQREDLFRDDFQRVTKWTVIFSTPLFVILAAFAPTWMALMGSEFVSGAPVLLVLACSQMLSMFTGSTGFLLAVRGRPGLSLLNATAGWGVSAVLTFVLAGAYGALGAAAAYFAAILVFVVLEATECLLVFGFFPVGRSILQSALLLSVLAVTAIFFRVIYPWSVLEIVVLSIFLLGSYALAIWRIALQPVDIVAFKGILGGLRRARSVSGS